MNFKIKFLEEKQLIVMTVEVGQHGLANAWNIIRNGRHSLRVEEAGTLRKIHHSLQNRSFESMCTAAKYI